MKATALEQGYFEGYYSPTLLRYSRIYVYAGSSVASPVAGKLLPEGILPG